MLAFLYKKIVCNGIASLHCVFNPPSLLRNPRKYLKWLGSGRETISESVHKTLIRHMQPLQDRLLSRLTSDDRVWCWGLSEYYKGNSSSEAILSLLFRFVNCEAKQRLMLIFSDTYTKVQDWLPPTLAFNWPSQQQPISVSFIQRKKYSCRRSGLMCPALSEFLLPSESRRIKVITGQISIHKHNHFQLYFGTFKPWYLVIYTVGCGELK